MSFEVKYLSEPKLKEPILIEGLPGIGNVGKIAADFLVDTLKAKKFLEIHSHHFPHSVFINEDNLINLPIVECWHKKVNKQDFIILTGDIQPIDEVSCYKFCETVVDIMEKYQGKEIVTLGGIGLQKIPKKPKVYITGTDKNFVSSFKGCSNKIYGVVGPIMGVTGVLLGSASKRGIPAVSILTQTFGHPAYLGIKGSKETLTVLNKKYNFNIDLKTLSEEIAELEKEIKVKSTSVTESTDETRPEANYFG
ncbi:MAG: PAC2 family protein [archaeon]